MIQEELQKYYQSKYPQKDKLSQEELDWISSQEDIDWAIENVLQARQNKNTEEQHKRNKRYWANPIKNIFNNWIEGKPIKDIFKGTNERWSASLDNNTNPINGLVNVGLPAAVMTGAVMNPFGTVGAIALGGAATLAGDAAINAATDGKYASIPGLIQDKTGLSRFTSELINPLMLLGGKYGYKGGTNIGSKLFNGLHLPIGYDPVQGWYKRRPYPIMQETPALPAIPSIGASQLEVGQKPFAVLPASAIASVPASARRVQALSVPTELQSSGVSIITPPTDLSRGTWDFYRSAMQENPILALPSVQAWLQQYGDVRTPQQWMLAGTRNLNLQSGANNPRSVLYRAFGNVYGRNGVYSGTMPPFAPGVQPMRYEFTPGQENPLVGQFRIAGQPPFEYDISNLPFRADFQPVIRGGWGNRQYAGDPVMRLAADRTTLTRGEGNSYLDIFARPIEQAQRRLDNREAFLRGRLPRRGTTGIEIINGIPFQYGTNIFGNRIWRQEGQYIDGTFNHRWQELRPMQDQFRDDQLPAIPENIQLDADAPIIPSTENNWLLGDELDVKQLQDQNRGLVKKVKTPILLIDPHKAQTQNRGLALTGNMGHYQLKSLMQDSPLEKQVNKNGEINVNNLLTYIQKNGSPVEQAVVQDIINSKFPNQKYINYSDLKAQVASELIQYTHNTQNQLYSTVGLEELGHIQLSDFDEPVGKTTWSVNPKVYLLQSDRITSGNKQHYPEKPLGHIRTMIDPNESNIMYILESQSDWGQKSKLHSEYLPEGRDPLQAMDYLDDRINEYLHGRDGDLLREYGSDDAIDDRFYDLSRMFEKSFDQPQHFGVNNPQELYLHKNHQLKQIQEAVLIAARNKQTKLRFPTEQTAFKIEGYENLPPDLNQYIVDLNDPKYAELKTLIEDFEKLSDELETMEVSYRKKSYGTGRRLSDDINLREPQKLKQQIKHLKDRLSELRKIIDITAGHISPDLSLTLVENPKGGRFIYKLIDFSKVDYQTKRTPKDLPQKYQTILKKYSDFPKMWKKLFKTEPRIVTDSKGNTWYEVDVPEGYLDQEWQFKTGGKLNYLTMFR